jgi:signal transduction histidine kinase/ActR/RegA family two-component response regulator
MDKAPARPPWRALLAPRTALPEKVALVALGLVLAMGLRTLLTPWLGDSFPLLLAFPVVAFASLMAGIPAALVLGALCMLWVGIPWLPPNWPAGGSVQVLAVGLALLATALVGLVSGRTVALLPQQSVEQYLSGVSQHGAMRSLRNSIVLAIVVPLSSFALLTWSSYHDALDSARERVDATVRVAAEHAARVIETNKVITEQLMEQLADDDDARVLEREQAIHERLKRLANSLPQVQSIWVWGSDGRPLVSNRFYPAPRDLNVSDREYFRVARDEGTDWYVTEILFARATGEPFFDVTRRRSGADGGFRGVISVSLHPSYFTQFYARFVQAEPGLALSLLRADGAVIARFPQPPRDGMRLPSESPTLQALQAGKTEGWVAGRRAIDGAERLVAFRRIEDSDLAVAGAIDRREVLGAWARSAAALGAVTFGATIALVLVLWVALRRAQLEVAALERLRAESEQRRRAEDALRQAQKLEALGRLTGGVAHDFNNLLTVINNNAFLLNHLLPRGAHDAQVAGILRAVKAGEKLTRQLLAFSRKQALRPEVVNLGDALPGMTDLLRTTLGSRVDIAIQVTPDAPRIEVDRAELELALLNMALNARDAMNGINDRPQRLALMGRAAQPDELARLLPGRTAAPGTRFAVISVTDTGSGIDPAIAERIFEPFFTTKPPGEGTGLGLSQVYGFCVQAGGGARVDSTPGQGTTVSLVLPATARERSVEDELEPDQPARIEANVLLVEDNEEVAATTTALLRGFGAQVTHAADAHSALQLVKDAPQDFDVVLSDVVMPGGMSGLDLARALRKSHPGLPVVLITGYTAEIHHAMAAGFHVLSKPCAPNDLSAALSKALGSVKQPA